jgi:alkyl hydroperoxide reductase subunit AhpF
MAILSSADAARVKEMLAGMTGPVRLAFFTQALNCETCEPTGQILRELAALTDRIVVEEHNFLLERDLAASYGVDRVPAIVPIGLQDYGIRFLGIPSGYEFMSLLDAILLVSSGESGLADESRAAIEDANEALRLQVFVTPT